MILEVAVGFLRPSRFLKENRASVADDTNQICTNVPVTFPSSNELSQALPQKPPNGSHQMAHPRKAIPQAEGARAGLQLQDRMTNGEPPQTPQR